MSRNICIVTGTRAEYGLLKALIGRVHHAADLELQLIVTGMHLAPEFGSTVSEIEADGFPIAGRVEMLLSSDTAIGVTKSTGLGMIGFADTLARLHPDLLVVLGDRFEILSAATAAMFAGIPIAHIHGGETTEGAFDEAIRHSITKMAHLHFVAAEPYRRRVIQLGEDPKRVFMVGALGVDAIRQLQLMDRAQLESSLGRGLGAHILLITFHPATLDLANAARQMHALLAALAELDPQVDLIFTLPNADTRGRELGAMVREFVADRDNAEAYDSLGHLRYLSLMAIADGVVGNSSSGIIEAPALGIPTLNIGDRQTGRLRAPSIIDCDATPPAIGAGLAQLLSARPTRERSSDNGGEGATNAILAVLRSHPLDKLLTKRFHDLEV